MPDEGSGSIIDEFLSMVDFGPSALKQLQAGGEAERSALRRGDFAGMLDEAMQSPMLGFGVGSVKSVKGAPKLGIRLGESANPKTQGFLGNVTHDAMFESGTDIARRGAKANKNSIGFLDPQTGELTRFKGGERPPNSFLEKMALRVQRSKQNLERTDKARQKFIRNLNKLPPEAPVRKDMKALSNAGFELRPAAAESGGLGGMSVIERGKAGADPLLRMEKHGDKFIVRGRLIGDLELAEPTFQKALKLLRTLILPGKGD